MKLSLTQLEINSYASQMNDAELTNVKGGSGDDCALLAYLNSISLSPVTAEDIQPKHKATTESIPTPTNP